jgi:hypothetical protein
MCKAPATDQHKLKTFDIAACQTLMQESFCLDEAMMLLSRARHPQN